MAIDPEGAAAPTDRASMTAQEAAAELAGIRLAEHDLEAVLQRVVDLARQVIPGAAEVSVTLVQGDRPYTAAFTGQLALDLDERQYERGYGPCLDAAADGGVIVVTDMAEETRWPDYAAIAVDRGCRSSLSIALPVQHPATGGLNIYGTVRGAFDERSREIGSTFAGYAAVAVANAHLYSDTASYAAQMWQAMQTRAVIEQAKGILVRDQRCDPDEAFEMLREASMRSNRKLRDIAVSIVDSARRGA